MWYPTVVTTAPGSEAISLGVAKSHLVIGSSETFYDEKLTRATKAARDFVEKSCGTPLMTQTHSLRCDSFADLAVLPVAPVQSVTSVTYVDTDGANQTLSTNVYELRTEGLTSGIVLKYGQSWPSIRSGSRITVSAVVGYTALPDSVQHALLMLVEFYFGSPPKDAAAFWESIESLLCNNRAHLAGAP